MDILAKQFVSNNQREMRSLAAAHHAVTKGMQVDETVKSIQKIPDVERGI